MKRPRVRIGTLMYLVEIAAMAVALGVERRRSSRLLTEAEKVQALERQRAVEAMMQERAAIARVTAFRQAVDGSQTKEVRRGGSPTP